MAMVIKPKVARPAIVPDGLYQATLTKVTQFSNVYGQRIGFEFTLESGEKVMRSTSPALSDKGHLANVLKGVLGRDLSCEEIEQGIDVESLIGTCCQVLVMQAKSKAGAVFSNIEKVLPYKA